ncbi:MAG: hypothetical protein NVS1B10_08770 [Candidatus Saccharimonadales bacterium]
MRNSTIKVNDILECSWGYEQTNVDFYEVIKVTKNFITVQRIGTSEEATNGFMTSLATPNRVIRKEIIRRKVHNYGAGEFIKPEYYSSASVWDGTPQLASHYA